MNLKWKLIAGLLCSYISGIKAEKDLDGLWTPCFSEEIWKKKKNNLKIENVSSQLWTLSKRFQK